MNKTVQGATKPKRAPPKKKYLDPIVSSTFDGSGGSSFAQVLLLLDGRLKDTNSTVVLKTLIVLHILFRNGDVATTFEQCRNSPLPNSLSRLAGHGAGNVPSYARYLHVRLRAFGAVNRDVIRDKSERRPEAARLRKLSVAKGLLREVREVQRMIAALVDCKFFLDDVSDDVAMTAYRLLVKDLLVLFTCVNEGVINVLENCFEMSHTDATEALKIYKTFCRDTEKVVAYLSVAKKLNNVLNVPIPNLRHAPVSLVRSLEEYLNDPDFEENRRVYAENKRVADGKPARVDKAEKPDSRAAPAAAPPANTKFIDFFDSIEQAQTPMFTGGFGMSSFGTGSFGPGAFGPGSFDPSMMGTPALGGYNPFMQPQQTGFVASPFMQQQATGVQQSPFMQQQATGVQQSPFVQQQATGVQQQPFIQQQATGALQPQQTGFNPFYQTLQTQPTGAPNPFRANSLPGTVPNNPFGPGQIGQAGQINQGQGFNQPQPTGAPFNQQLAGTSAPTSQPTVSSPPTLTLQPTGALPQRQPTLSSPFGLAPIPEAPATSASTPAPAPATATTSPTATTTSPTPASPLAPQKTGAHNPFRPEGNKLTSPAQGLSLNALATQRQQDQLRRMEEFAQTKKQDEDRKNEERLQATRSATLPASLLPQRTGLMSSIASDFALPSQGLGGASANVGSLSSTTQSPLVSPGAASPLAASHTGFSTHLASQRTGSQLSTGPAEPQRKGTFSSTVKPFQPSSSFGNQLAEQVGQININPFRAEQTGSTLAPQKTGSLPFTSSLNTPFATSSALGTGIVRTSSPGTIDYNLLGDSTGRVGARSNTTSLI